MTNQEQTLLWYTAFKCILDHENTLEKQQIFSDLMINYWKDFDRVLQEKIHEEIRQKVRSDNNSRELWDTPLGHWKARDVWVQFYYMVGEIV